MVVATTIASLLRALTVRPEVRSDAATRPNARGAVVEEERDEVGLGLLQHGLAGGALRVGAGHERADGQLGERDGGDERHRRQHGRVVQPAAQLGRGSGGVGACLCVPAALHGSQHRGLTGMQAVVADHVASVSGITVLDLRSSQDSIEIAQRDDERIVSVAHANLPVGVWRLGLVWALGRERHGWLCRSSETLGQKSDDERVLGDAFRLGTAREERVHVAGQPDAELAARKRWIPRSRGRRQGPTLGSVRLDGHLEDGLERSQGVGTCGAEGGYPRDLVTHGNVAGAVGIEEHGGGELIQHGHRCLPQSERFARASIAARS